MTMLTSLRGLLAPSIGQNLRPPLQGAPPTSRARMPSCAALGSAASHTHTEISHLLQHGKSRAQCTLLPVAAAPHKHRWSLKHPRFSAAAQPSNGAAPEEQEEDLNSQDDAVCAPAFVSVDNQKNPNFTVMEIEVLDYPGLMRVLAWVLNGLDIVAQNAVLSTSNDSVAQNTLWLSTRSGKKLKDASADLLAERVRDFLTYCSPRPGEEAAGELSTGLIKVSNTEHPTYTVITVQERKRTPGFLLEVTSVLTGLNVEVRQGVIQGCIDCGDDVPKMTENLLESEYGLQAPRLFKFWVKDRQGGKLDPGHVRALVYALGLGLGYTSQRFPLTPPNREFTIA